jgi:hypothetical protein
MTGQKAMPLRVGMKDPGKTGAAAPTTPFAK